MCLVQDRQKLILLLQKAYFGQLSEEEAGCWLSGVVGLRNMSIVSADHERRKPGRIA